MLALLFLIERYLPRVPAAITVLVLAIIVSALLDFESRGIHIVGEIPAGLPSLGVPGVTTDQIISLIPGALAIMLVAYSESIPSFLRRSAIWSTVVRSSGSTKAREAPMTVPPRVGSSSGISENSGFR